MRKRTSAIVIGGLFILALIGLFSSFTANPAGFIQSIAVFALIGLLIFYLVRRFSTPSPQKREQRAFLKAAKKSKKRLQQRGGEASSKGSSLATLTTLKKSKTKKNPPVHLTVIEGKKNKKKNRASF